jgi:hypothetical protein
VSTRKEAILFSGHYLRNRSTFDISVLGYIGLLYPKEHPPEVWHIPPGTPYMCVYVYIYIYINTMRLCVRVFVYIVMLVDFMYRPYEALFQKYEYLNIFKTPLVC